MKRARPRRRQRLRFPLPPLGLDVVALVALLHLPHGQLGVEPVELLGFQVLQQQAEASRVLHVWTQTPADQDGPDNRLRGRGGTPSSHVVVVFAPKHSNRSKSNKLETVEITCESPRADRAGTEMS